MTRNANVFSMTIGSGAVMLRSANGVRSYQTWAQASCFERFVISDARSARCLEEGLLPNPALWCHSLLKLMRIVSMLRLP